MPARQTGRGGSDSRGANASFFHRLVTLSVYWSIPLVAVGVVVWLAIDAFTVSPEAGARSLCAALLPVLMASYIRWVKSDWLAVLDRLPNASLMVGAAVATIAILTVISASSGSHIVPQFAISFGFCTMLLARTDIDDRGAAEDLIDLKLLHVFFGVAIALTFYGLFRLKG